MRDKPKRIQRQRVKGWRMPEETIYVGRPTVFGNPFPIDIYHEKALELFEQWLTGKMSTYEMSVSSYYGDPRIGLSSMRHDVLKQLKTIRGKDLACWCKENAPCHADILLRLANACD